MSAPRVACTHAPRAQHRPARARSTVRASASSNASSHEPGVRAPDGGRRTFAMALASSSRRRVVRGSAVVGSAVAGSANAAAAAAEPAKKKVLVPVSDGTEEMEAVTVIDVLRRAGADVTVAAIVDDGRLEVTCSRGVKIVADVNVKDVAGRGAANDWDLIAVPGGMPGAEHIADHIKFHSVLEKHFRAGKLMAAICAAPAVCFEPKGFLEGYAATAHPAFVDELGGSLLEKNVYAEARVVVDKQIVTSRGPGTSLEWALCLVEQLYGKEHAKAIAKPMVVQPANAKLRTNLEWRLDETPIE